jgi:hypothetical protein
MSFCTVATVAAKIAVAAADHEHSGRDHRRGVDQGGNRGRTLHGVRKPGVEAELRRLAHRADEQEDADERHRVEALAEEADGGAGHARRGRENLRDVDGAEDQERREDAQREAEIADPVDQEGLERRRVGRGLVVPEADEQVGGEANALPAEEHLDEVVRRHQHQHREGEERQVGEEAGLAVVLRHIAPAVEVDERRDCRHHHEHYGSERIHPERPVDLEAARVDPGEDRMELALLGAGDEAEEDRPGQRAGGEERRRGDQLGGEVADQAVAEAGDDRRQQRQEDDELDGHAFTVTPAKAGVHAESVWMPALAGMT